MHKLFLWYPWKFHILNPPCLIFFWNSPFLDVVIAPVTFLFTSILFLHIGHANFDLENLENSNGGEDTMKYICKC